MSVERDEESEAIDGLLEEILTEARQGITAMPVLPEVDRSRVIVELRAQLAALHEELAYATDKRIGLTIERNQLRRTLDHRAKELAEAQAELTALRDLLEAVRTRSDRELRALRWQLAALQRELAVAREESAAAKAEVNDAETELASIAAERDTVRLEATALRSEVDRVRAQADAAQAEAEAAHGRAEQVRIEAAEAARHNDETVERLHRQLQDETAVADSLGAELARVERRLSLRAVQLQAIRRSRSFRVASRASAIKYALMHPRRARRGARPAQGVAGLEPDD
jgi:chromosome segregation ATPase